MRLRLSLAVCMAALAAARPAPAAQIWFGGQDPVVREDKHRTAPMDWMDMFAPNPAWPRAYSRLDVFKISMQMALRGSDDMLRTVAASLRAHHVALAIEMGAVTVSGECGGGEGYIAPNAADRAGRRLRALGVTLDYWAMDEPVWFGHEKSWGRNTCTYPIGEITKRVAANVAVMRHYFPNLKVGDIEVLTANRMPPRVLLGDYAEFARGFAQLTGTKLAFFHADVAWQGGGDVMLGLFERTMRGLGVRTGFIIGGDAQDGDSPGWVDHGLQRFRALYADPATRPDDIIVQSWQTLPDHDLPETDPGAFTHMLLQAEQVAR